jgi:hypothetical protein
MPMARDWSYLSQRDENATGSSDLSHVRHVCDDNTDGSFSKVNLSPIFPDNAICLPSSSIFNSIHPFDTLATPENMSREEANHIL